MTVEDSRLPTEDEARPWYDASLYDAVAARAGALAAERYDEAGSRARHLAYLTSLKPGARPFES
jgi:hypothetical protein